MLNFLVQEINQAANHELELYLNQLITLQEEFGLVKLRTFAYIIWLVEYRRQNSEFEKITGMLQEYIKLFISIKNLRTASNQVPSICLNGVEVDLNKLFKAFKDLIEVTIEYNIPDHKDTLREIDYISEMAEKTADLIQQPTPQKLVLLENAGNQLNGLRQSIPLLLLKAYIKTLTALTVLAVAIVGACSVPFITLSVGAIASVVITFGACMFGSVIPAVLATSAQKDFKNAKKQEKILNLQVELGLFSSSSQNRANHDLNTRKYVPLKNGEIQNLDLYRGANNR